MTNKLYSNGTDMTNKQLEHLWVMLEEQAINYAIGERKESVNWKGGISI